MHGKRRTVLTAVIAATVTVTVAACGGPAAKGPVDSDPAATDAAPSTGTALRSVVAGEVTFSQDGGGDGGEGGESAGRVDQSVIASPGTGVRVTTSIFTDPAAKDPEEVLTDVWDGSTLLRFDSMADPQYVIYQAVDEHAEAWDGFGLWSRELIGPTTGTTCQTLDQGRIILRREAAGYRCATAATAQQDGFSSDVWFDKDTGVLLQAGPLHAATFKLHQRTDGATFSTAPPAGSRVDVIAARHTSSGDGVRVPPFTLELSTSGTARSARYAGHSYVLVFFSSDTYWESPDSCPGCLSALTTLQQLTAKGTKPAVLAVKVGGKGKPGYPVPAGVTLPIANDPAPALRNALGLSNEFCMAFVGPDGTVKVSYDSAPTSAQLRQGLAAIS